ncbi:anthranilate synthase component I family protein [Alcanivorax sp.]|uniref:anthranilate synthase component I family protein n=1 Tax=Alcanivorax sp. TaxID=1872427 RepID=UPI000C0E3757|nr:anthranilate synthase component I family protein [Alcanivorax sp.]PHR65071.1 MAG: aminodeoxychorismate synthase component I [Alcanivorax sp.]
MTFRCVFQSEGELRWLGEPDAVLRARSRAELQQLQASVEQALAGDFCFAAGILPYEAGAQLQGLTAAPYSAWVYLYKDAPGRNEPGDPRATETKPASFALTSAFQPEQTRNDYLDSLARIRDYLRAGDCYQVNLAQRFSTRFRGSTLEAWLALQQAHPAPHSCFFKNEDGSSVFGVSPERFLSIRNRQVITEPIKGSRPRGRTPKEDDFLADELQANPKDQAENLMIVDLLRNDLGISCESGSIQASPLFELRRFSNVQHLVSTITGTLKADVTPLQALFSAFPGGSITGAPKKRAMEIIAELEPVPRGAYCGSFFWMDDQGNLDSNILIRTLQTEGDNLYCHGGGGIVFDSEPEAEYEESCFKVAKLMGALEERFLSL